MSFSVRHPCLVLVRTYEAHKDPDGQHIAFFSFYAIESGPFQSQTKMGRREKPFGRLLPMKIFFLSLFLLFSSLSLLYPQFPNAAIPSFIGSNGCSHFSEQREEKVFWLDGFFSKPFSVSEAQLSRIHFNFPM